MKVTVNGVEREVADGSTVRSLIEDLAGALRGSAVVVDDEVVPRSDWDDQVADGARIELITAVQGG